MNPRHLPYDQLTHEEILFALGEEIGDPELFVGRKQEMARLMKWAEGTKRRISGSLGILARRKKGKTALLQRFFNLLYTRHDPQLIPFYYRVYETRLTRRDFAIEFYCSLLSQYFAFTTRTPELVARSLSLGRLEEMARDDAQVAADIQEMQDILDGAPDRAWPYAQTAGHRISQLNGVRIIQIIDEFQNLNKWIVSERDSEVELLCHSYMGAAESKFSPQIVVGSYIGWLEAIFGHMTARYDEWHLEGLSDVEALAEVYNYAYIHQVPITDETAPYIAEVCENDPFYIAAVIRNRSEEKDLTTHAGIRDALSFETTIGQGAIARVWNEYLADAIHRVNDKNAHKMVLYLARHEPEERTRTQIKDDLKLEMSDPELDKRLKQLVYADILTQGGSNFHFRGLGDPIFAMVFRRIFGAEIEQISVEQIDEEFKKQLADVERQLASAKGLASWRKGEAAEFKVRYQLLIASLRGAKLADLCAPGNIRAEDGELRLGPFESIRKNRFYVDQERSFEADLHAVIDRVEPDRVAPDRVASDRVAPDRGAGMDAEGADLIVEVKAWEQGVPRSAVEHFIEMKEAVSAQLERRTVFLFYSESELAELPPNVPFRGNLAALLREAGIGIVDPARLASYEASP